MTVSTTQFSKALSFKPPLWSKHHVSRYYKITDLYGEELLAPCPIPNVEASPLFGCPELLSQHNSSRLPSGDCFLQPLPVDVPWSGDRNAINPFRAEGRFWLSKPVKRKAMRTPFKSRSLAENTVLLSQASKGPHR